MLKPRNFAGIGIPSVLDAYATSWLVTAAVGALLVAAVVVHAPGLSFLLFAGAFVLALTDEGLKAAERWTTILLLAGAIVLDYGFANAGIRIQDVPVPLTEVLLIPLVGVALLSSRTRPDSSLLIPLLLYLALTMIRFLVDFSQWGILALRDTTMAVETLALVIGYRSLALLGVRTWIRWLKIIFIAVLSYASLYPWAQELASLSPIVGLQREVPLLGLMAGTAVAVAAAGLFFGVFARGVTRVLLCSWALVLLGIFQQRGLYVTVPLALLLLAWSLGSWTRLVAWVTLILIAGGFLLSFASSLGFTGRVGELDPAFYVEHARTLGGQTGPSAGTIDDRIKWTKVTLDLATQSFTTLVFGVGLGPDLTGGFRVTHVQPGAGVANTTEILVRKPHNDYLEVLGRTGLTGLALFVWLLGSWLRRVTQCARRMTGYSSQLCAWILASSFLYLGIAATQPLLSFPYGTVPLFMLLGIGASCHRSQGQERTTNPRT